MNGQAGADIVPVYFFGNSLLHDLVGGEGADNWLFKLSRKVSVWCQGHGNRRSPTLYVCVPPPSVCRTRHVF